MKKRLSSRFKESFFWNFLYRLGGSVLTIASSVLIARFLKPHNYGMYATLTSLVAMLPLFVNFGLGEAINVYLPKYNATFSDKSKAKFLVTSVIKKRIFFLFILVLTCVPFVPLVSSWLDYKKYYLYLALLLMVVMNLSLLLDRVFIGFLKLKSMSFFRLATQLGGLIVIYLILKIGFGIGGILAILVLQFFVLLFFYFNSIGRLLTDKVEAFDLRPIYTFGMTAWLVSLMNSFLAKDIGVIFLNIFRIESADIGFYKLAFVISGMVTFFTIGLGPLAQSLFSEIKALNDMKKLKESWSLVVKISLFFIYPVLFFIFYQAKHLIVFLYSDMYLNVLPLLRVFLAFKFIYLLLGTGFIIPLMYSMDRQRTVLRFILIAGGSNILLDLILIPLWGSLGAVIATGIATNILAFLGLFYIRNRLRYAPPLIFALKISIAFIIALLPTIYLPNIGFLNLSLKFMTYCFIATVLLFILKPLEINVKELLMKTNPFLYKILRYF